MLGLVLFHYPYRNSEIIYLKLEDTIMHVELAAQSLVYEELRKQ